MEILQEVVRAALTFALAAILILTIVLAFSKVGGEDWGNTKELLQVLLPLEATLLSGAVGFYFGTRRG